MHSTALLRAVPGVPQAVAMRFVYCLRSSDSKTCNTCADGFENAGYVPKTDVSSAGPLCMACPRGYVSVGGSPCQVCALGMRPRPRSSLHVTVSSIVLHLFVLL
jgi:hypothetical protein